MAALHRPIWIRTLAPDLSLQAQEPPRLIGDAERLDRVMSALRQVRQQDCAPDIVSGGRVRSLEIGADEAVLTLRLEGGRCGSAQVLAELAFDVLREQLPDLDLYLRHEHSGCPNH